MKVLVLHACINSFMLIFADPWCMYEHNGASYTGSLNTTGNGSECLTWSDPAVPLYPAESFPDGDTGHNYCRNPKDRGGRARMPWCFVMTDSGVKFEYCEEIQLCDCPSGQFGAGCKKACRCRDKEETCNHVFGSCRSGCAPGWTGIKCQRRCPSGYYGFSCRRRCLNCFKSKCDPETGRCLDGCKPGFKGDNCSEEDEIPFVIKVSLPCVAAFLLIFFSLFLLVRSCNKRRHCCREKDGDAFERGTEYSVLEQNGRTFFYPQHASIRNSMTHSKLQNDRSHGNGIGGFEERTFDQGFLQNHQRENSQTVMHRDTGVMVRLEPRLKDFNSLDSWREYTSNEEGHPSRSGLPNSDFGLENDLFSGSATRRKSDGEVEVFKPGQKGYISMSSTNRGRQPSCRSKAGYITARPEMRRPVNVCHPLAKPIDKSNISEETQEETPLSTSDVNQLQVKNPIYERLDRYYRPSRRVESCPSSRHHDRRMTRGHYDSLPIIPLELSTVEIPIGPFVSRDKGDRNISETEDFIKHRDSFEKMFDGAWWHSESDTEDSPPKVPDKQLRNKNRDLPPVMASKNERPTSYVTMNRKNRHKRDCRTCKNGAISLGAETLPQPFRPNHGSYMTHGQMMRGRKPREEENTPAAYENCCHSLPPLPTPCTGSRSYVNFQNAESTGEDQL